MKQEEDIEHEANVDRVQAFLMEVLDEAQANPVFAARLAGEPHHPAPGGVRKGRQAPAADLRRSHRREPGPVDPFEIHDRGGETELRKELGRLDVERLKDIVAEHGMDRTKLAMRWRTADRLIGLIVETVDTRARKGDAFRQPTETVTPRGSTEIDEATGRLGAPLPEKGPGALEG